MALREGALCFYNDKRDAAESWALGYVTEMGKTINCKNKEDGRVHSGMTADHVCVAREDLLDNTPDDLLMLTVLHDSTLLHCLKLRYMKNVVYTNIGAIVVALNPFNYKIPHYMDTAMPEYLKEGHTIQKNLPHSWGVANNTYWEMINDAHNQCILVSGESGAGKTEAAKIVMKYLSAVSCLQCSDTQKSAASEVGTKILNASPILEAFGNAKTVRNDNSSRFGKFSKVKFDAGGVLVGNNIVKYLLEKSRIISANPGERVYHAFYLCVQGRDRAALNLGNASTYRSVNSGGCLTIKGVDDAEDYALCRDAMDMVGIDAGDQQAVWRLVAGTLNFQNVLFESTGPDSSRISSESERSIDLAVEGFKVDGAVLRKELLTTTRSLKGEIITSNLKASVATDGRDALTKVTYDSIFSFLVDRINEVTDVEDTGGHWIGLLDIFGFEDFDRNSFEQVCINLANETLQGHYNTFIFRKDMDECQAEGIDVSQVECPDNTPCLELITGKLGVFALLDEECCLGEGSDKAFLQKLEMQHAKHPFFAKKKLSQDSFIIKHYASDVTYDVDGFREKNMDPLKDSMKLMMRASQCALTRTLIDEPPQQGGGKKVTVTMIFKKQLADLLGLINTTNPHWIRCVKPHPNKQPLSFHGVSVMNQLSSSGVLGTVKIRKAGYPVRILFDNFVKRFSVICETLTPGAAKEQSAQILAAVGYGMAVAQCGATKVFLKSDTFQQLEVKREESLLKYAARLQRVGRGTKGRFDVFMLYVRKNIDRLRREKEAAELAEREAAEAAAHEREQLLLRERNLKKEKEAQLREEQERNRVLFYTSTVKIQKRVRGMLARIKASRILVELYRAQYEAQVERRLEAERVACERIDADRVYSETHYMRDMRSRKKLVQSQAKQKDRRERLEQISHLTRTRLEQKKTQQSLFEEEAEQEAKVLREQRRCEEIRQQEARQLEARRAPQAAGRDKVDRSLASALNAPGTPGGKGLFTPRAGYGTPKTGKAGPSFETAQTSSKPAPDHEEWERNRRKQEKFFAERSLVSDQRMEGLGELYAYKRVLDLDMQQDSEDRHEAQAPPVAPLASAQQQQLQNGLNQMQSEGPNIQKWTVRQPLCNTPDVLAVLCNRLIEAWHSKPGDILDELLGNLVFPSSTNAPTSNYVLLLQVCEKLRLDTYGHTATTGDATPRTPYSTRKTPAKAKPATNEKSLLTLLVTHLLTQTSDDIDRLLTWKDAPRSTESEQYKHAYRERFNGKRNVCVYSMVCGVLAKLAESAAHINNDLLVKWSKIIGLSLALSEPLPAGRYGQTLTYRVGAQAWDVIDNYRQLVRGNVLGLTSPLSCTAHSVHPCGEAKGALRFNIHNAQEGICPAFSQTQYPHESEIILPPFAMYRVRAGGVVATPQGIVIDVECAGVVGSMSPEVATFRQAVLEDLREAELRLAKVRDMLDAQAQVKKLPLKAKNRTLGENTATTALRSAAFEESKVLWQEREDWKQMREGVLAQQHEAAEGKHAARSTKHFLAEHRVYQNPPSVFNLGSAPQPTLSAKQKELERDYQRRMEGFM